MQHQELHQVHSSVSLIPQRASHLVAEATSWTCTTLQTQAGLKTCLHRWWFLSTEEHGALGKDPFTVCWPGRWLKNYMQL